MAIRLASSPSKPLGRPRPKAALVPAAARTTTALTIEELDLSGDAIESFTAAVGGRAKLLATLAVADTDGANDKVINCLLDPQYKAWSLRRICAYAGLTVADLFASYKKALFVAAHVEAAHRITTKLPGIVDDVMTRATPYPTICPHCSGIPPTPDLPPCSLCHGSGTVLSEPEIDRQKLALELGRLLERKGGVVMQQNQIAAATTALTTNSPGSLEQLQQAVGDLLFAPGRQRARSPARRSSSGEISDPPEPSPRRPEEEPPLPFPPPRRDDDAEEPEGDEDADDQPLSP